MRGAEQVTFGGSGLDRAAELRGKPGEIASLLADPSARLLPVWRGKPLFAGEAGGWLKLGHEVQGEALEAPVFLGRDEGAPRFACDITSAHYRRGVRSRTTRTGHPNPIEPTKN